MSSAQQTSGFAPDAVRYGVSLENISTGAYYALAGSAGPGGGITSINTATSPAITLSSLTGTVTFSTIGNNVVSIDATASTVGVTSLNTLNGSVNLASALGTVQITTPNTSTINVEAIPASPQLTSLPAATSAPPVQILAGTYASTITGEASGAKFMGITPENPNLPILQPSTFYRISGTAAFQILNTDGTYGNASGFQFGVNTAGVIPSTLSSIFTYQVLNQAYPPNTITASIRRETIPFNVVVLGTGTQPQGWWKVFGNDGTNIVPLPSTFLIQYTNTSVAQANPTNNNWSIELIGPQV